jgi:hypothetical protein
MSDVKQHRIVSHEEWIHERKALLSKEKEFNKLLHELSARRRELRLLQGPRDSDGMPHVLDLLAWPRHVERGLSLSRHRPEGARRRGRRPRLDPTTR